MTIDGRVIRKTRTILRRVARRGKTITYKTLAKQLGVHWRGNFRFLLGAVCAGEIDEGRPPLTAVVVTKLGHKPQAGWYLICRDMNVNANWGYQLGRCHGYWQKR